MPLSILSIDFESSWTTPVNPKQCRIFEIGAVLFDWEKRQPLHLYSTYVYEQDHPPSPIELLKLTGIQDDTRRQWGVPLKKGLQDVRHLFGFADYIIAHNGNEFDKPLLIAEGERCGIPMLDIPWLDSKTDIDYPDTVKSRKLTHLCAELGFVNPFSHRALFDALSVIKILQHFRIDDVIANSKKPTVKVIAQVSYENRLLARERGYYWNGEEKYWWCSMKIDKAELEKTNAPFPVRIIEQC